MTTTTKLTMAAALVALASTAGCSLLFRAAKGELTPMGVTQASSGDVYSLAGSVGSQTDPAAFAKAFTDLASIYMYKCMENPTMVPASGSSDLRQEAGAKLLEAMQARVAAWGDKDPVLDGASAEISGLPGKLAKCDEGKRNAQDPSGSFTQAVALATTDGRAAHVQTVAKGLDASLEQALNAGDDKVPEWVSRQCGVALPEWGYCMPRAAEGFYSKGKVDGMARVLLSYGDRSKELLAGLGAKVGKDQLAGELRKIMTNDKSVELPSSALNTMITFLRENGGWKTCEEGKGLVRTALKAQGSEMPIWGIEKIIEEGCRNFDDDVINSLADDNPWVRHAAAVAVGELKIQKAKKHVDRLRTSDPYMDEGCWCRPVRDAAANSYNKLEIDAG